MNINIENFYLIKKADLKLNSISLIGAENDTGKSTIGKILFSIFYCTDVYLENFLELTEKEIKKIFDKISLEKDKQINIERIKEYKFLKDIYFEDAEIRLPTNQNNKNKKVLNDLKEELILNIKNYFLQKEELDLKKLSTFRGKYLNKGDNLFSSIEKRNILMELRELQKVIGFIINKEAMLFLQIMSTFKSEFSEKISNFNSESKETKINIQEGTFKTNILFKDGKMEEFMATNFNKIKDVIYIETPLLLDTDDSFENIFRKTLREKLQNKKNQIETKEVMILKEEVLKKINNVISGKLYYDQIEKKYKFKRSDEDIQIKSVASGIKSFGIIALLLENNHLTKDTILIIDEPEVHLHPKWQIKYAEILCILSKNIGLKILVNSHSPYFIEAISVYSNLEKYNLKDTVKFYTYECYEDGNILIDKTNDLGFIYNKLAEPYDILSSQKYEGRF